jgi:hypothetical protein
MEQSPSWKDITSSAAGPEEFPSYRRRRRSRRTLILRHLNPIYIVTTYVFIIHFSIILQPNLGLSTTLFPSVLSTTILYVSIISSKRPIAYFQPVSSSAD